MHKSTLGRSITVLINLVFSTLEQPKILYAALSSTWFNISISDFVRGKTSMNNSFEQNFVDASAIYWGLSAQNFI